MPPESGSFAWPHSHVNSISYSNITVTVGDTLNLDLTTVWSGATSYMVDGEPVAVEDMSGVISGLVCR